MQSFLRVLAAAGALSAATVVVVPAHATSMQPLERCAGRVLPATLTTIPRNAPALLVVDASEDATIQAVLATSDGAYMDLRGPATGAAAGPGARMLPLPGVLDAGRIYDLAVAVRCSGSQSVPATERTRLVASEEVALPTSVGTLKAAASGETTKIRLHPSPGLGAYLPLSVVTLRVNGVEQARIVGAEAAKDLELDAVLAGACIDTSTGARLRGAAQATVVVSAHVAGASSDPQSATHQTFVDCDAILARVNAQNAAGEGSSSDGCSIASRAGAGAGAGSGAGSRTAAGTGAFAALALATTWLLRRRTQSRTRRA